MQYGDAVMEAQPTIKQIHLAEVGFFQEANTTVMSKFCRGGMRSLRKPPGKSQQVAVWVGFLLPSIPFAQPQQETVPCLENSWKWKMAPSMTTFQKPTMVTVFLFHYHFHRT